MGSSAAASLAILLVFLLGAQPVRAQPSRWSVDPKLSLAWWQVNPHLNHLWATTCPQEPSWRPGEDRISGPGSPRTGYANVMETVIPLYPRPWVLPLCAPGVTGEVVIDTTGRTDARGLIVVSSEALTTGQPLRDEYARKTILVSGSFPDIRFYIDSLTDVRPGDTLLAKVVGRFEFRGQTQPMVAAARAWREAGGLRVLARFDIPPSDLTAVYGVSKLSLGLGVGSNIWKVLHLGIDVILKEQR